MVILCNFSFLVFEVKQETRQLGLNDYICMLESEILCCPFTLKSDSIKGILLCFGLCKSFR